MLRKIYLLVSNEVGFGRNSFGENGDDAGKAYSGKYPKENQVKRLPCGYLRFDCPITSIAIDVKSIAIIPSNEGFGKRAAFLNCCESNLFEMGAFSFQFGRLDIRANYFSKENIVAIVNSAILQQIPVEVNGEIAALT